MIIALSTMSAIAHGGRGASKLNLLLFDDGNFTIVLDGIRYPNVNRNFRIPQLYAGTHRIKIVENFFGRNGRRTGKEVLYAGPVNVPYNSSVTVKLTPNNRLKTVRVVRNQHRHSHTKRRGYAPRQHQYRGTQPRNGRGYGQGNRQFRFNEVKRSMRHAGFEKDKLDIARETVRSQRLSAHQIAELMNLLNFESSRVKLAKFGYRFSGRNPNYLNIVSRSFEFSSSRRELARFIRTF
jgi:hypothetical protein